MHACGPREGLFKRRYVDVHIGVVCACVCACVRACEGALLDVAKELAVPQWIHVIPKESFNKLVVELLSRAAKVAGPSYDASKRSKAPADRVRSVAVCCSLCSSQCSCTRLPCTSVAVTV